MFWKFWLPVLLMGFFYLLGRKRSAGRPTATLPEAPPDPRTRRVAIFLAVFVACLIAWFVYRDWHEAHQEVEVRVTHVQTGEKTVYRALKRDLHGRAFLTVDGRRITLADVERMEVAE
ncbi:MAG: antitermination protein NusG [Magnetococcales bacterium]|nr:antitermination protein NusG [Magnetococcales bacterium]